MTTDKTSTAPVMSLQERVEFALRDAGFSLDEAFNLSANAVHPNPDVVGGDVVDEGYDVARHNAWLEANAAPSAQGDADVTRALQWLHVLVTSSHNHDWKRNREEWAVIRKALAAQPKGETPHTDLIAFLEDLRERYAASEDECACDFVTRTIRALSAMPAQEASHPAEQVRGDGVVGYITDEVGGQYARFNEAGHRLPAGTPLYAAPRQAVPYGLHDPDNPWRRAVEHAGYLVTNVEQYMEARNAENLAFEQVEGADDPSDEQVSELEAAQQATHDHWCGMRSGIYEFAKRRDRALATLAAAPSDGRMGVG